MKTYSIANWASQFENSRSRSVEDLRWVPIPNRHDGENYSQLVTSESGAEIFAAWVLIVQVASKCNPRGKLVKDNGTPHDAQSLSIKTRAPKVWFAKAIPYLEKHTDWLIFEGSDTQPSPECHPTITQPSPECQQGVIEGRKEENGIEEKEQCENAASAACVGFDSFWQCYPKKIAKPAALKAFKAAIKSGATIEAINAGVNRWSSTVDWMKDGGKYVPHPATFLNQQRWNDAPQSTAAAIGAEFCEGWRAKPYSKMTPKEQLAWSVW